MYVWKKARFLALVWAALTSTNAYAGNKVIYGEDNREEANEVAESDLALYARSTAAMIKWEKLTEKKDGYEVANESHMMTSGVCVDEPFAFQRAVADCSGFLVAEDLLLTANHCVPANFQCNQYAWVFDYHQEEMKDGTVAKSSVYRCKEIVSTKMDEDTGLDYSLIRLEREVKDRNPLKLNSTDKVTEGAKFVVIGHPSGLPTKVTTDAKLVKNTNTDYFRIDADTYGGNSGSAVINVDTGEVQGILVGGAVDYRPTFQLIEMVDPETGDKDFGILSCLKSNKCKEYDPSLGNRCSGERVVRLTSVDFKGSL